MDPSLPAPAPSSRPRTRADRTAPASSGRKTWIALPPSPFAPLAHALLFSGATAAVFLAGGPPQGSLGVFLAFAGAAMIACPPRVKVEWRLWLAAAALLACATLALLPEHAVPQPAWRRTLDATPPIVMPGTISTAPDLTVFWLALLTVTLLAGLFLLAHPLRSRWLLAFALAASLAVGIYAALSVYAQETGWHYPFTSGATFGFFPNRNHTATLLIVGSLVALGVLGVVLREGRWFAGLLAGGTMAVCVTGLGFYSLSRGGIVFLLLGVALWLAGLGRHHRNQRLVVSLVTLTLAGGAVFLLSGGDLRDRFLGQTRPTANAAAAAVPAHGVSTDGRLNIYRDTGDAIRDFPLTGMGLGTFVAVIPQYRRASLSEATLLHPESDWVLLAAEAGIPAILCLLTLVTLAVVRLKHEREHPYWPLRWGCIVAAGAAAAHGMVDVPVHAPPLGWWVLVVAGLALQSARFGDGGRSRAQHAVFVAGGVAAFAMGGWLIRAEWFGGPVTTPFVFYDQQKEFFRVLRPDPSRALRLARQMAREHPMEEMTYRLLGETLCLFDDTERQVDAAFRAERLTEPVMSATPLEQGNAWLDIDPARVCALWLDALARCTRNYQVAGLSQHGTPAGFFAHLLQLSATKPRVQEALWSAVDRDAEYAFVWVENANSPQAAGGIGRLAADAGFLRGLDKDRQRRFLRDWYSHGDRDALTGFLDGRSDWQDAAWPVRLRRLADAGQYEQAVRQAAGHYGISFTLPEPGSAPGAASPAEEQETNDPVAAFLAYWTTGNIRSARRVLDEATVATNRAQNAPLAELWRLKTAVSVHESDWPSAWRNLEQEIRLAFPGEAF